jgi:hypothetical protein
MVKLRHILKLLILGLQNFEICPAITPKEISKSTNTEISNPN